MTTIPDPDVVVPRHLEDEDLLAYLDGELPADAHRDASLHLERCWDCRTRLAATHDRIEAFMHVCGSLPPGQLLPAEPAIAAFQERLTTHATAHAARARSPLARVSTARLGELTSSLLRPSRPAFALLALGVATTVGLIAWFNAPLSADAVLARAEVREMLDVRQAGSVVKSVVEIDRVESATGRQERLSVVETVADFASPAVSIAVGTPDGAVVRDVLWSEDQLLISMSSQIRFGESLARYAVSRRWVPGVSVAEYRKLISDRGLDESSVVRSDGLVELRHPFRLGHASGLVETRLRLDARTWLPTGITLVAIESGIRREYRLTRTVVEFVTRTSELAAVFDSARPGRPVSSVPADRAAEGRDARRRPLPLAYADSLATPAEVAVAVALHDAHADLGDEINVFQMSDGSLLVQGLLDNAARKREIETALQSVAGPVRVEIHSAATRRNTAMELFEAPWRSSALTSVDVPIAGEVHIRVADFAGAGMPMYERLHAYFAQRASQNVASSIDGEIATLVTDLLQRSNGTLFHVWALRKLDWQFSERRVHALPPVSLEQIEALRRAHRARLGRTARELADMIRDIAPQGTDDGAASSARADDGRRDTQALLLRASEQNELVRALFATSAMPAMPVEPSTALARLKVVLQQLEPGS